jgi:hypothetical protein
MVDIFRGRMTLAEGEAVVVELEVGADAVRLVANGASIGAWPIRYCRVTPAKNGTFDISIDGEPVVFEPNDPVAFARVAAGRFVSSSLADRISTVKLLPAQSPPPETSDEEVAGDVPPTDLRRMLVGAAVAATLVAAAYGILVVSQRPDPPVVAAPTSPATTAIPATPWYEMAPAEFVERWNRTSVELGVGATLPNVDVASGLEAGLSEWIYFQGTTGDDGTMDAIVITLDPTGPPESDETGLAVWGLAMATVDPLVGPDGRRAILGQLGIDPDNPQLEPVESTVDWGSNRYSLQYLAGFESVLFRVEPRS